MIGYKIPYDEFIKRAVDSGVLSEDRADTLYVAYSDENGYFTRSPEDIVEEDKKLYGA